MVNKNIRALVFYNGTDAIKVRALDCKERPIEFIVDDILGIKEEPDILIFKCQFATIFIREDQLVYSVKKGKSKDNMLLLNTGLSISIESFWKQLREQHPEDDGLESGLLLKLEMGTSF